MAGDLEDPGRARRFHEQALPHLDEVYTLARYLLRNRADADDAVQDCYLRALKHFETFRGGPIRPWLFAILRNVCRSAYSQRRFAPEDDAAQDAPPLWSETVETPESQMLRQHNVETVRAMVGALPDVFREVVVLREINDLSYDEIAGVVGVPIGTVMSRLARGRSMLRAAWLSAEEKTS
jgi:RNA polymerase sigma-70 factor, ECF subfamily